MGKYKIKKLYDSYFQKSRVFLYPALDIKRGTSITPIQTYTSWKDKIDKSDRMLLCQYHLRDDPEFLRFEEHKLLNNDLFCDYFELSNKKAIYVFTFDDYRHDWYHFNRGEYSKLSPTLKSKIKTFYGEKSANYKLIHSYLYPDKYFDDYSDLLGVNTELLKDVGELCSKPDLEKELFTQEVKNDIKISNITDL